MRRLSLVVCLMLVANLVVKPLGFRNSFSVGFQTNGRFISEEQLKANLVRQAQGAPEILSQLRKRGITGDKSLKLLYYFYTNIDTKAKALVYELNKLGYIARPRPSASIKDQYAVTGWTTKIKMDNDRVIAWTKKMCELDYKFDCDFDGWETSPDAEPNK